MKKISFLILVYNQAEELCKCISCILPYPNDDIEVVVSDDCSTDDLSGLVDGFHDERIRYYRNKENVGLDGNILFGIEHCSGKFVFLLRTQDYVIVDSIRRIIELIDKYPNLACVSGTSLDDDGLPNDCYEEKLYKKGKEAFNAHDILHFHPSGSAFKRKCIDLDLFRYHLKKSREPQIWFMVDQLIRLQLATKGDFYIISQPIWRHTITSRARKPSVHRINNIYDQYYTFMRYESEMDFVHN